MMAGKGRESKKGIAKLAYREYAKKIWSIRQCYSIAGRLAFCDKSQARKCWSIIVA